jgi:hypothetical protein
MWWNAYKTAPSDKKKKAWREVFTVGFVSLLPLLLGIFITIIKHFNEATVTLTWQASLGIISSFLLSGQLFFFALSFAGSIIYVSSDDYHQGNFPPRLWFFMVAFICSAISFAFIGLDPKLDTLNNPVVFVTSFVTYAVSAYAFYILLILTKIDPPSAEQTNRDTVSGLSDHVRAAQEQQQ